MAVAEPVRAFNNFSIITHFQLSQPVFRRGVVSSAKVTLFACVATVPYRNEQILLQTAKLC